MQIETVRIHESRGSSNIGARESLVRFGDLGRLSLGLINIIIIKTLTGHTLHLANRLLSYKLFFELLSLPIVLRSDAADFGGQLLQSLLEFLLQNSIFERHLNFTGILLVDGVSPVRINFPGSASAQHFRLVTSFIRDVVDVETGVPVGAQNEVFSGLWSSIDKVRLSEIGDQFQHSCHILGRTRRLITTEDRLTCTTHSKQGADANWIRLLRKPPHERQDLFKELWVLGPQQIPHHDGQDVGRFRNDAMAIVVPEAIVEISIMASPAEDTVKSEFVNRLVTAKFFHTDEIRVS